MTFNTGMTYTVELNDGGNAAGVNNDHINATGTVTINGGTVHVTPENGTDTGTTYAVGTVYTIVTAAGGVTGTFATVTDNYAYLNFALSYDANNVYLTSQLAATSFCLPGMTGNQCATGNGVFSLGAGTLYTAVLNLSNAEAPGALNQLSGEIHSSAKTALVEDSHFVRDTVLGRIRSAFESVAASSMPIFSYAPGGLQPAPVSVDRFAVWGHAFGAFGHINGGGNAANSIVAAAACSLAATVRWPITGASAPLAATAVPNSTPMRAIPPARPTIIMPAFTVAANGALSVCVMAAPILGTTSTLRAASHSPVSPIVSPRATEPERRRSSAKPVIGSVPATCATNPSPIWPM